MLPILFWKIETYYVLWSAALVLMCLWTRRRATGLYGMSRDDVSDVLWWVLLGVFVGATIGGYIDRWDRFAQNPWSAYRFWESGLSSGPGFIGGGLLGVWRLRRLGISVDRFAESASAPTAFMLALGRWGCFANGCCRGLPTTSPFGVRFPSNPNLAVWPSQLFESAAAFVIGLLLLAVEGYRRRRGGAPDRAVSFPIFLITYGGYRIIFDFLREGPRSFGLQTGQYSGVIAALFGIGWLIRSARSKRGLES
jgi:phosphatidylglycerol:prolipoprotein diacylglycerol transferase